MPTIGWFEILIVVTVAILVVGMAGSGKTSFIQRFNSSSHTKKMRTYIVNIDPATTKLPYIPNIDIRDTVNFKKVMKDYNLGPNGAILTAANLFATRFDQVISLCERRRSEIDFIVIDTPGQIEIFTWSASGTIITEAIAEATPKPCVPYAKRQIGTPIFPVFGSINGGSSILRSFLSRKSIIRVMK